MSFIKWLFGPKEEISNKALEHSSKGEFKSNGRMKSGGHGEENLVILRNDGIDYTIVKTYSNGVRVGNVPSHDKKIKRSGTNQSWFPKSWSRDTIKRAGQVVARGEKLSDGDIKSGFYGNVYVGIIRTNQKIATIFPMSPQRNKKGAVLNEYKKNKTANRRKR